MEEAKNQRQTLLTRLTHPHAEIRRRACGQLFRLVWASAFLLCLFSAKGCQACLIINSIVFVPGFAVGGAALFFPVRAGLVRLLDPDVSRTNRALAGALALLPLVLALGLGVYLMAQPTHEEQSRRDVRQVARSIPAVSACFEANREDVIAANRLLADREGHRDLLITGYYDEDRREWSYSFYGSFPRPGSEEYQTVSGPLEELEALSPEEKALLLRVLEGGSFSSAEHDRWTAAEVNRTYLLLTSSEDGLAYQKGDPIPLSRGWSLVTVSYPLYEY